MPQARSEVMTVGLTEATEPIPDAERPAADDQVDGDGLVVGDLLVEDVSIDGMCGVY